MSLGVRTRAVQVRVHDFQIESLKMLTRRILLALPAARSELQRENALYVPGELAPVYLTTQTTLLVCKGNGGKAKAVAREMQSASKHGLKEPKLEIRDAAEALAELERHNRRMSMTSSHGSSLVGDRKERGASRYGPSAQ